MSAETRTVAEAVQEREKAHPDAQQVFDLIECCLNAEAALMMMGAKRVPGNRRLHFKPVGALTLEQIDEVLARTPDATALVKASMAFECDYCGCPAETGTEDGWICEQCFTAAINAPSAKPSDERS